MKLFAHFDWIVFVCVLLLCGYGSAILLSVAPGQFDSQIIFYLMGFCLFFLFSQIDYRIYHFLAKPIYFVSLFFLVLTIVLGLESRGAVRWISIGSFRLQFSEIVKPFLIASFAVFLSQMKKNSLSSFLKIGLVALVPFILIFRQPDLGSALVFLGGFSIMVFASGINLYFLGGVLAVVTTSLPVLWHFLADYQKQRIISFISPGADPQGASYNAIQAVITVGSGMFFGQGLGFGTQTHLLFLPEKHTDFVFASVAEEFGFLGTSAMLFIYFILLWRILSYVGKTSDQATSLTLVGIGGFILVQLFINVGMNMGILPVTGITLPLVSYGGSSVLATMIVLGIAENIIRSIKKDLI
jgi:rod shape determining protein RodA